MPKYDCSKTADYLHEWGRMCESLENCSRCPVDECCDKTPELAEHAEECIEAIQQWSDTHPEPERDLVEVVRCKDCKHGAKIVGWDGAERRFCSNNLCFCDGDDYCSHGERRDDQA